MTGSVIDNILREREMKNEKTVAIIRFILAALGILEFLSYHKIISVDLQASVTSLWIGFFLLIYSTIVLIILLKNIYLKYLKFFVIFFDYMYVTVSFILIPNLTVNESITVWLAFGGVVMFYLINLLRYSKEGTIFAGILSVFIFFFVNIYFKTPVNIYLQVTFALAIVLIIGYVITTSNKKMMIEANTKKLMERYLPPQLVGELYKKNASLEPGGKKQEVTILFSDIESFTTISEKMKPEEIVKILNQYLSTMTEIIFENEGTIDKFIGDAIMVIFGAPIKKTNDAIRAIKTAISMNIALNEFNQKFLNSSDPFKIGIGIHTGEVISGNIGSDKRLDYTVIGDNVNLSSRIEGLTRYYHCPILITETTKKLIDREEKSNIFLIREVDNVIVKGKSKEIKIFEVMFYLDESEKIIKENIINNYNVALKLFKEKNFREASIKFKSIKNDKLSELYYNRCTHFIENPPDENWNGTYKIEQK